MMFDMIKSGKIAGSRLLHIVLQNVETETAEDVMGDILRFVIPQVIKKYLPEESYQKTSGNLFDLVIKILKSGKFSNAKSTMELLLSTAIDLAATDEQAKLIYRWFMTDKITDL